MDLNLLKEIFAENPEPMLDALGISYKRTKDYYLVICPFHNDTSFGSTKLRKGLFHCFACGESADVFTLTEKIKQISFPEAVRFIASAYGLVCGKWTNKATDTERLTREEKRLLGFDGLAVNIDAIRQTDEETYKLIVLSRIDYLIEQYMEVIRKYGSEDSEMAYNICELTGNSYPMQYDEIRCAGENKIKKLKELKSKIS